MGFGTGEAPFLSREHVMMLARVNQAAIYEGGLPVSQLFLRANNGMPKLLLGEKAIVEFLKEVRRLGKWHSQPADPDAFQHTKMGLKVAQTLYKNVTDSMPANHTAQLRQPGVYDQPTEANAIASLLQADAAMWLQNVINAGTNQHLRDYEWLACQMLQNVTFAITIDGVTDTMATGLAAVNPAPGGTVWSNAAADIPGDIVAMRTAFRTQAGGLPDIIIRSYLLDEDLAANDAIRTIAENKNIQSDISSFPNEVLPADLRTVEKIVHDGQYDNDAAGTQVPFWSHYKITFIKLGVDPQNVLMPVSAPTRADNYMGGIWANTWEDPATMRQKVAVGFNGFPLTLDTTRIMTWDVSTV